jgi:hypothetical protein
MRRIRRLAIVGVAVLAPVLAWRRTVEVRPGAPGTPPYLTVFMLDGLSQAVFQQEMAAGRLPHIGALVREGVLVQDGISAFPSMTAYGFYPFLTGHDAARSGILGLRWFDRRRARGNLRSYVGGTQDLMNAEFAPVPSSIYERVQGQHSFTVNTYANRGAVGSRRAGWSFGMAKYRHRWWLPRTLVAVPGAGGWLAPSWESAEDRVGALAIEDLVRRPKVQWMTFGSIDGHQHVNGTDARYAELVRHADRVIGRYREASRRLGQEGDRIYAVLSDHGVADVRVNVDLRASLAECCGLRARRDSATRIFNSSLDVPLSDYDGADALIAINGNMLNFVYLRDPAAAPAAAWARPLDVARMSAYGPRRVDVVEGLRRSRGVEMVMARGVPGRLHVFGRAGHGVIDVSPAGLAYTALGADPLGYAALGLADGRARSPAQWLEATHGTTFPDAPGRIAAVMTAEAAGDLAVTALPDHDFGLDYEAVVGNYRGGHGGLRADQLRVPYVLAGPGVRAGARIDAARAEDVGATLLAVLGLAPEPGGAGRVLREALTTR